MMMSNQSVKVLNMSADLASPLWGGTKILQLAAQRAAEFLGGGLDLQLKTPTQIFLYFISLHKTKNSKICASPQGGGYFPQLQRNALCH